MTNDIYVIIIFIAAFLMVFVILYKLSQPNLKKKLHHNLWANIQARNSSYMGFYKEVLHRDEDGHYLNIFLSLDGSNPPKFSWNWPAASCTILWLIYRGMTGTAAIIASALLGAIFMAPIKTTLSIYMFISLALGAFGTRYYHFLVRRDIETLLEIDTPSHAIKTILHQNWDSKISIADMGMSTAAIILGGLIYFYEFDDAIIASKIKKLGSKLPTLSAPDLSSQLRMDAKYTLEDIKNLFRRALHKESVASLLLSKIKAETRPAKQKEIFILINAAATEGNPLAQFAMGMIYRNGYLNILKDINLAIYWYRQSATNGNMDAKLELGKLYLLDVPNLNDNRESESWLKQATDQGSTVARDLLRQRLEDSANPRREDKTIAQLISQSGKGEPGAMLALLKTIKGEKNPSRQKSLVNGLRNAAMLNNASAEYLLGLSYQYGYFGLTKNTTDAISWYKQSALHGNVEAQVEMGRIYLTGGSDRQDPSAAEFWLNQAADQGSMIAKDLLRQQRDKEAGSILKDQALAESISRAISGDPEAKSSLMERIAEEQDPRLQKTLLIELTDAAMSNNALGAYFLGMSYQNGYLGLPKNTASAIAWFKESAANGNLEAKLELGKHYLLGGPKTLNPSEAGFWLKEAAEQGSTVARDLLNRRNQPDSAIDLKQGHQ